MKRIVLILAAIASFAASTANAQSLIRFLGPPGTMPTHDPVAPGRCAMGSASQPAAVLDPLPFTWVVQVFDPLVSACGCPEGFQIHSLHLVFAKMDAVTVRVGVELSLTDAYPQAQYNGECPWPTHCGEPYTIGFRCPGYVEADLSTPGFYEAVVLVDCACVSQAWAHGLSIRFSQNFGEQSDLRLVTDDQPGHCPDWLWHSSWFGSCTWEPISAPGHFVQWCEVSCCDSPVVTEERSWGTVKQTYR